MQDKVYIFYTILLWNSKLNKSRIKRHVAAFWNLRDRPRPIEITHTNVLNITLKRVLMVLYHLHLYILGKISTLDILLWNSSVNTWFCCQKLVVSGNNCWKYSVTNFLIWIPIKQPQLVEMNVGDNFDILVTGLWPSADSSKFILKVQLQSLSESATIGRP